MTQANDLFIPRHIGPSQKDINEMLQVVGSDSLETLVIETIPKSILSGKKLNIRKEVSEHDLAQLSKKTETSSRADPVVPACMILMCLSPTCFSISFRHLWVAMIGFPRVRK